MSEKYPVTGSIWVRKWNCGVCRGPVYYNMTTKDLFCNCGTVPATELMASTILEQFRPFRPRSAGETKYKPRRGFEEPKK